jgi:hypothetical protein
MDWRTGRKGRKGGRAGNNQIAGKATNLELELRTQNSELRRQESQSMSQQLILPSSQFSVQAVFFSSLLT